MGSIAVEISMLTQHVTDDRGTRPRLADDRPAELLVDELDQALQTTVPDGMSIVMVLSSPIAHHRKTRRDLEAALRKLVGDAAGHPRPEQTLVIHGNTIAVSFQQHGESTYNKIMAAISNRPSSPNILANARHALEDRIKAKAAVCAPLAARGPVWLALLNDYWLADAETYRQAIGEIAVDHPFARIVLVDGNGTVTTLHDVE